ncbi:MAG: helix-turn-helix domain-containing protein [Candidatus Heimdallarchaeum endolithica]|uniref:Putative HTH-type transcriptional regulatory protein K9W46_06080 n=1 Tax=Candidatus Heimdallarchaeum endolithica TaxID=2876572 RepID=A0A9Y1BTK1_9ARCH|nr:MAG: helix-turn-helix domain-containing protein [Candidatus Heimdallarchaeum endolithica]
MFSEDDIKQFNENLRELMDSSSRQAKEILRNILLKVFTKLSYSFVDLTETPNTCFDIIAKKENKLTIIKIEPYIDNFLKVQAQELKNLSAFLQASPVIIGVRGKRFDEIQDGLVLFRHEIPVISLETFLNLMIDGLPPVVYCSRGGYYVRINRNSLRKARLDKNLSYSELARLVGISRRTMYEYEHSINPPPETAILLEDILDISLTQGIPVFNIKFRIEEDTISSIEKLSPRKEEIATLLEDLGLISQFWVKKMPFDAYGEHGNHDVKSGLNVLLCVDENKGKNVITRVEMTQKIASIAKRRPILIIDEEDHPASELVPTFTIDELQEMKKAFDLVKEYIKKYALLKENIDG